MHSFRGSSRNGLIYTHTGFHNNKTFETTHDETFKRFLKRFMLCHICKV
jgi:hypothetical protein